MTLQRNAIFLTAEKGAHLAGALLSMILVARYLGRDTLADYGFAISVTAFFIPFLDLGLNNRIIKDVAGGGSVSRALSETLAYKLGITPAILAAMIGAGWLWGGPQLTAVVVLVGISTIGMSLGDSANSVFKGLQRSHLSTVLIAGLNVVLLLSLMLSLESGAGLLAVGGCFAASRIAYAVACFVLLRRVSPDSRVKLRVGFDRALLVDGFLHLPGVYFLGNVLSLTYLVTYVVSPSEAGVFYVGYRAAAATYVIVSAGFEAVLASSVARGSIPRGIGTWFVLYSVIALLLLYLAAPAIVPVFGPSFASGIQPVRILASCVPPFALCGLGHTLLMAGRDKRFGAGVMSATVVGAFCLAWLSVVFRGAAVTAALPAGVATVAMVVVWVKISRRQRP